MSNGRDPNDTEGELSDYWELIRRTVPESAETKLSRIHPGDLVIGTSRERVLVRISADGSLTYGPEYTPDEAAVTFWTAMATRRIQMEERFIQIAATENLLAALAKSDIVNESAQRQATQENATERDNFLYELSQRNLTVRVHDVIEFARGLLAARPDLQD